jgi:hypothetical protein
MSWGISSKRELAAARTAAAASGSRKSVKSIKEKGKNNRKKKL